MFIKKYYFFAKCLCLVSLLSPLLIFAEPAVSAQTLIEKRKAGIDLDGRLTKFFDVVKDLQNQGRFDGEVLVARDGQILFNLQSEDIASSDATNGPQFMIGSISKQFFAVALLKALYESSPYEMEEQKIADVKSKLHLPISQFLPHDSTIWEGNMPTWAQKVSLHHLLTHTSGIGNYSDTDDFGSSNFIDSEKLWFETYRAPKEILNLISQEPLLFSPGSQFSYCNTGYVLIAEVIEAVTSVPASIYIQQELFDPIGLSSTASPVEGRWDELRLDPKLSRLVAPFKYDLTGEQLDLYPLLYCEDISVAKGAGSIISTSADLLKWNQSLHKDKSVLPNELYKLLVTANMDDYGYGIGVESTDIGMVLDHRGKIGSYTTLLLYMPEHDLSIILLSNICYDFDKIEDEYKAVAESLRDIIPNEEERNETALKMILEKYPDTRGFERVSEELQKVWS